MKRIASLMALLITGSVISFGQGQAPTDSTLRYNDFVNAGRIRINQRVFTLQDSTTQLRNRIAAIYTTFNNIPRLNTTNAFTSNQTVAFSGIGAAVQAVNSTVSSPSYGLFGQAAASGQSAGVYGGHTGSGYGVYAQANSGVGGYFISASGSALQAIVAGLKRIDVLPTGTTFTDSSGSHPAITVNQKSSGLVADFKSNGSTVASISDDGYLDAQNITSQSVNLGGGDTFNFTRSFYAYLRASTDNDTVTVSGMTTAGVVLPIWATGETTFGSLSVVPIAGKIIISSNADEVTDSLKILITILNK